MSTGVLCWQPFHAIYVETRKELRRTPEYRENLGSPNSSQSDSSARLGSWLLSEQLLLHNVSGTATFTMQQVVQL
jgi:hypothetical protein